MTKVNPNNVNEIKSGIFPWDILRSDIKSSLLVPKEKYPSFNFIP